MGLPPISLVISVLRFAFQISGPPVFLYFSLYISVKTNQLHEVFLCFFRIFLNYFTDILRVVMDNIYVTS